ncbi:FUSC family protein [Actinomadura sp. 7K507]|uniref:FUSC family protein n=1 Tax=Actinomadura sp. 7K507 TaxID=2530365 RepID=UPI001A9D60CA|nr:FUSC family protein [Actinomadura sp. 7K507]
MRAPRLRDARTVAHRAAVVLSAAGLSATGRRPAADAWILVQATAGATAAWLIARYLLDHPAPFFAPIAAIIALIANLGERGLNAVRLLLGVIIGLLVGEIVLVTMGAGTGVMPVAILCSLAVARVVAEPPIVAVQAAFSAILVVAVGDVEDGLERLVDALTGTGVALVFTQLLFAPEPLALLRRAERAALTAIADGLATTARAIVQNDDELADRAVEELGDVRDRLADLRKAGRASTDVTRRALVWRAHTTVIVRENENAGHLDLLNASCVMLARLVAAADSGTRRRLERPVRDLAEIIASLAGDLGDRETRQKAADRSLGLATHITAEDLPAYSDLAFLANTLRMVATDLMTFAGVDYADAIEAVREGTLDKKVSPPATAPHRFRNWLARVRRR